MPFPDFLRRRIFAPLKMRQTVAYVDGQNTVRRRAYGYSQKDGQFHDTDQAPPQPRSAMAAFIRIWLTLRAGTMR